MREFHKNKKSIYELNEWEIAEKEFIPENNYRNETIFSLGNGYLGMRGNIEEGFCGEVEGLKGTYINAFYESEEIIYGEYQYGFPKWSQTMLNVIDTGAINLFIEDEKFSMNSGKLIKHRRILNMKEGKLRRELTWESPKGNKIEITVEKFISHIKKNIAAIKYSFKPLNFSGNVIISSVVDGDVRNTNLRKKSLSTNECGVSEDVIYIQQQTKRTKFDLACAVLHETEFNSKTVTPKDYIITADKVEAIWNVDTKENDVYSLCKYIYFNSSKKKSDLRILDVAIEGVKKACMTGFSELLKEHVRFLEEFWDKADIKIKGDVLLQQGIRYNILQLLQSVGKDGCSNIAAKGLTGEGYEGHYFWDTETYILPFFLFNKPEIAKSLIMHRYNTLENARKRARELDHPGALYAWRTIDGDETSAYFEASTAQYHINADIVYAIKKYVEATEDWSLLKDYGAEIIWETARLWADRGGFIPLRNNKFCIHEVTGPDEYKVGVNNNCYTNYMAKMHLEYAVEVAEWLKNHDSAKYHALQEKIGLQKEEIMFWEKAATNMFLPYNSDLNINPQDDSFIYKESYDIENIPTKRLPLVFNWHPLNIWRYQICKQADVLLLMFLQSDKFTKELKKSNYDYYEPKTIHDSSLSASIFSIIAAEIGYKEQAYNYFMQTVRMDLDDYNNNVHQGIHTACMAGAWMCVVNGFAGMRVLKDRLTFEPYLPEKWEEYEFKTNYKGRIIRLCISKEKVIYTLLEGNSINIYHYGKKVELEKNNSASIIIQD